MLGHAIYTMAAIRIMTAWTVDVEDAKVPRFEVLMLTGFLAFMRMVWMEPLVSIQFVLSDFVELNIAFYCGQNSLRELDGCLVYFSLTHASWASSTI
jgi:hypothetical protein